MLNLSSISSGQSLIGRVLRAPLRLIPRNAVVPILQGPLCGKKWIAGSSNHGCWIGSYEHDKQSALQHAIKPGDVIYDIGANVGFYTLLSSVLTGNDGHVYAFEPLPGNLQDLRKHIEINHLHNCTVIEAAIADKDGEAHFDPTPYRSHGRLLATGTMVVRTIALDSLLAQGSTRPPSLMKIDIEGAEVDCLRGATETIAKFRPIIFLATHSADLHAACVRMLMGWSYDLTPLDAPAIEDARELIAKPP